MTREELKAHCEKQIKLNEMWAKHRVIEIAGNIYDNPELMEEVEKW